MVSAPTEWPSGGEHLVTLPERFLRTGPDRTQMREWLRAHLGRPGHPSQRWWTVGHNQLGFTWPEDAMEFRLRWL